MSDVKRYDCTNGGARYCQGCYTMTETDHGEYVASEDYDALAAENERLNARIAELSHDAELYRRLRSVPEELLGAPGVPCVAVPTGAKSGRYVSGDDLNAAMSVQQGAGGDV